MVDASAKLRRSSDSSSDLGTIVSSESRMTEVVVTLTIG
jgi:hypothetical protein